MIFAFLGLVIGAAAYAYGTSVNEKQKEEEARRKAEELAAKLLMMEERRNRKKPLNYELVGLQNPSLILDYGTGSSATTVKSDFTEYNDRAIIQLRNDNVGDVVLRGASIRGNPVTKITGLNGFVWEYSDYDAIEKNGESFSNISNDYIVSALQCKSVGDLAWKEAKQHKVYFLSLIGCQYQYEIGDVYNLTLQYKIASGNIEDINTDVEILAVSFSRDVGGVGTTDLTCRVPSPTWVLSSTTPARLVGGGSPNRLLNRGNIVTVGASTYTGQADYYCDGTDDDVQIQAAIDIVYAMGGGTVQLTDGNFVIDATITMNNGITLMGSGRSDIKISNNAIAVIINSSYTCIVKNLIIDGTGSNISAGASLVYDTVHASKYYEVDITNFTTTNTNIGFECFRGMALCSNCNVYNNSVYDFIMTGFYGCYKVIECNYYNNSATYALTIRQITGFDSCDIAISCSVYSNTNPNDNMRGFAFIDIISSCSVYSNVGSLLMLPFYVCKSVSSCSAYSNTGTYSYYGFSQCSNVTVSSSLNNTGGATADYGFYLCKSVQQCKSDDGTKYVSSYADSGTANACADTAAGGYNS